MIMNIRKHSQSISSVYNRIKGILNSEAFLILLLYPTIIEYTIQKAILFQNYYKFVNMLHTFNIFVSIDIPLLHSKMILFFKLQARLNLRKHAINEN